MHKIAIITTKDHYVSSGYDDYSDSKQLIDSITDWAEVTEEEYNALRAYQYQGNYRVLERPVDTPDFILKTVESYKKHVAKLKQDEEAAKKKREEDAAARKIKKQAKDTQSKRAMLEKLKKELGEV